MNPIRTLVPAALIAIACNAIAQVGPVTDELRGGGRAAAEAARSAPAMPNDLRVGANAAAADTSRGTVGTVIDTRIDSQVLNINELQPFTPVAPAPDDPNR